MANYPDDAYRCKTHNTAQSLFNNRYLILSSPVSSMNSRIHVDVFRPIPTENLIQTFRARVAIS